MGLRGVLATAVALGVLGALGGCDDDPEPKLDDPTPSVSSATTEPTESATGSTETTVEPALGPEETVRAWVEARNAALQDGDTSAVDALSSPNCRSCRELNKVIRDVYTAGGSFDTPGWSINAVSEKADSRPVQVDTALTFSAGATTPSAGAAPVKYPEEKHIVTFKLVMVDNALRVQLVLFLS